MPYIGNQSTNSYSSMVKQDLTGASGASVTLSHPVANANEVELYINNVRQEPTTSYTTSGTTLSFVNYTVAASDDIYVIFLGKALQTTVPPDGSVSTAKIADSAVTDAKVASGISSSKLTGALPAIDGSALTGVFSIGVGQTWTDVTSSRAINTVYQNTTGSPIMVNIFYTTPFSQRGQIQVSASSGSGYIVIGDSAGGDYYTSTSTTPSMTTVSAIIPNNIYYKAQPLAGQSMTLTGWVELR